MPIYTYECLLGHQTENIEPFDSDPVRMCDTCLNVGLATTAHRIITGASIHIPHRATNKKLLHDTVAFRDKAMKDAAAKARKVGKW